MDSKHNEQVDIDSILEEIRSRVRSRKESGHYPPGLEEDLSSHFQRIVNFRIRDLERLRTAIEQVRDSANFSPAKISLESRTPWGSFLHRIVARATARQVQGILDQASHHARTVKEALDEILSLLEQPTSERSYMIGYFDSILERVIKQEELLMRIEEELTSLRQGGVPSDPNSPEQ